MVRNLFFFGLVSAQLLVGAQARAFDVFGTDSNTIQVVETADRQQVGFRLCSLKAEFECQQIGARAYYSKADLRKLRESEKWDVLKAIGADVVIVAATVVTGGATAYLATAGGGVAGTLYGTVGGAAAGGVMGGSAIALIRSINPHEQRMQLKTLQENVINDIRVDLAYPVSDFARRLTAVLDNFDSK